jgi:hypothetical protein
MARRAPVALVFRRGPSRWVQLIRWNTQTDEFERGQWFHGRIYERRCDLSPDGSLFIYFAQKKTGRMLRDKEYTYAWTAISKPPYFTALALWPKGDCWHGGGLFEDAKRVFLNHKPEVAKPHPNHKPHLLRIRPNPEAQGEDDPIYSKRLERDGWRLRQEWRMEYRNWRGTKQLFELSPEIREKKNLSSGLAIRLTRTFRHFDYSEVFSVVGNGPNREFPLSECAWADWDQEGRLVFARHGKLFAGRMRKAVLEQQLLCELNQEKPAEVKPPDWATRW